MKQHTNFLNNEQKITSLTHFSNSKDFIEYLNVMDYIYKKIEECNPNKKHKILIIFKDMIAEMLSNKKLY